MSDTFRDADSNHLAGRRFVTTSWSMVVQAGEQHTEESKMALERLCELYWYPLYAFVRRNGHSQHDAEELTQGFFAHLLNRNRLQLADQQRGRFRSFLLTSLENFIHQTWRKENSQKRGGLVIIRGMDFQVAEELYSREPVDEVTAEDLFDRRWALQVLETVMQSLQHHYESKGKLELFQSLKPHLIQQSTLTYANVAAEHAMNEIAVKVAAHRMRQRFRDTLHQQISGTVESSDAVAAEVADLFRALASS